MTDDPIPNPSEKFVVPAKHAAQDRAAAQAVRAIHAINVALGEEDVPFVVARAGPRVTFTDALANIDAALEQNEAALDATCETD